MIKKHDLKHKQNQESKLELELLELWGFRYRGRELRRNIVMYSEKM